MKRSKWDKVLVFLVFAASVALYVVDELVKDLIPDENNELKILIVFIGALSMFAGIWSFIWDNKVIKLHEELTSHAEDLTNRQQQFCIAIQETVRAELVGQGQKVIEFHGVLTSCANDLVNIQKQFNGELKEVVKTALADQGLIESRVLSDYEDNLEDFLLLEADSSNYAQIFIITNDSEVETQEFGDAICRNIINNHQYIYMTNLSTSLFERKLYDQLQKCLPEDVDEYQLQAAFKKNVKHISNSDFFTLLPAYSDMAVYTQNRIITYRDKPDIIRGYFAFQNGAITKDDVECYYYTQMPEEKARKIANALRKKIVGQWDSSKENLLSPEVEVRASPLFGNGCFAKKDLPAGTVVFTKGGRFIKKNLLSQPLVDSVKYIQINDLYVLSSLDETDDMSIGLPINHSCRNFNCGFSDTINIVTTVSISAGDELLIDYAFFDPDYKRFRCSCCCTTGDCARLAQSREELLATLSENKHLVAPYLREKLN